jgi:N-acetylglutamate synthase-like GNAT family acetyltransferase
MNSQKNEPLAEEDFYFDESGLLVFTEHYHLKRAFCCGSGCRHCPYRLELDQQPYQIIQSPGRECAHLVNAFYESHSGNARSRDDDHFFIARSEHILGTVRFCIENGTPLLRSMLIHKDFRNRRVGTALLFAFEHYLNVHGVETVYCLSYDNLGPFYSQIGFQEITSLPDFLEERIHHYRATGAGFMGMMRAQKK